MLGFVLGVEGVDFFCESCGVGVGLIGEEGEGEE
jgi:hypothetical protein